MPIRVTSQRVPRASNHFWRGAMASVLSSHSLILLWEGGEKCLPRPFKLRLVDHHCDRHRARSLLQAQVKFLINLEGVWDAFAVWAEES